MADEVIETPSNIIEVDVPTPVIGNKGWFVEGFGRFRLEKGPGMLRCVAVTHVGSAFLGIWDDTSLDPHTSRPLFRMCPTVLGHFMLDIGFNKGLIVEIHGKIPPFATIAWVKARQR